MHPGIHAHRHPDKKAAVLAGSGEHITYAQLDSRANRFAAVLAAAGVRTADHVAVLAENSLQYFEVVWAAYRSGLYVTPINRHLTPAEVAYIVTDSGAKVLVVSAALSELAEAVVALTPGVEHRLAFGGPVAGHASYEEAIDAVASADAVARVRGSIMFYSSGTTGRPKGVKRPLSGELVDDETVTDPLTMLPRHVFGMDENSVYLSAGPLYHAAPLAYSLATMALGGTVVVLDKFDAQHALEVIERHRVTHSQWVPTMLIRMLRLPADVRSSYDLSSMRVAVHAAAPCPVEVKRAILDWWGPVLWEYYSSSEAPGITVIGPDEWLTHPGSVGRPFGGIPMHVCDEESGREVGTGEDGVIYFDTGSSGFEYHGDAEKTRAAYHPAHPTWFTSGDIGHVDAEGYLYLTDRRGAMIISGGVNIYPQEVEMCINAHPDVADVAVFGIPDDEMGERVTAVVELVDGSGDSEREQELIDWVRSRIAHYKSPRSISFTASLPRTPTGKLRKHELKKQYTEAAAMQKVPR